MPPVLAFPGRAFPVFIGTVAWVAVEVVRRLDKRARPEPDGKDDVSFYPPPHPRIKPSLGPSAGQMLPHWLSSRAVSAVLAPKFREGYRSRMLPDRPARPGRLAVFRPRVGPLLKLLAALAGCAESPLPAATSDTANFILGQVHELNDNGAWSWLMDERAIVDNDRLLVGSVRAVGEFADSARPGWGSVELAVLDLATGAKEVVVLHEKFEQDDHNSPGLVVLRDGRYLAAWSKHGQEPQIYWRISSAPGDPRRWGPVQTFVTPGTAGRFRGDSVTYCNPIRFASPPDRLHLFHRGVGLDPNYLLSDDDGRTWRYGGRLFVGRDGYSPYVKYASNGRDTIHVIATEDHPRNFDNSLYHAFIRDGTVHHSDGTAIGSLAIGKETALRAWDLTRVFQGGPTNVAWMSDFELDEAGRPVVLFTVQRDGVGQPQGAGGLDHRFGYASWDGVRWSTHEIAHAGTRLYPGEDDYTGLGAIDPQRTGVVYISTDADPVTGKPLISRASYRRHHELFRGVTRDLGRTWHWTPVTAHSTTDNLRPIVPKGPDHRTVLTWMRGAYRVNRGEWTTRVMATLLEPPDLKEQGAR